MLLRDAGQPVRHPAHRGVPLRGERAPEVRLKLVKDEPIPLTFYTDGSCHPNPGPGGWAVIEHKVTWGEDEYLPVAGGHELYTSNIKMEGTAIIEAMRMRAGEPVHIITDSLFWIDTLTTWAPAWRRNGWKKKDGIAPRNLTMTKTALGLYEQGGVTFTHVRGHQGNPGNEAADRYALTMRQQAAAQKASLASMTPEDHRDELRKRATA